MFRSLSLFLGDQSAPVTLILGDWSSLDNLKKGIRSTLANQK